MKKALRPGFKLTDLKNLYLDNSKQKRKMKENKKRNERKCKIDNKRFGHILTLNNPEVCGLVFLFNNSLQSYMKYVVNSNARMIVLLSIQHLQL